MFNFLRRLFGPPQFIDFKALLADGALLVDVRTPEEFRSGHIKGSVNIPLQVIPSRIADLKQKNKPVIAVCRSGSRSGVAVGLLKNSGLEAYNGGPWNVLQQKIA